MRAKKRPQLSRGLNIRIGILLYVFFWVISRHLEILYDNVSEHTLFHLHRRVGMKTDWVENIGVFIREKVWLENRPSHSLRLL